MANFKFKYTRNGTQYEHILPAPIECTIEEEKVAKEGTGRSGNTGSMSIEYLGLATIINIAWDLLPSTKEYRNLYMILKYLPDFFTFVYPAPDGNNAREVECYNNKWSIKYFRIKQNNTYFRGLTTKFTSKNLENILDTEPVLEE